MTVTGGEAPEDQTRPEREPPVFPQLGDSGGSEETRPLTTAPAAPLFSPASSRDLAPGPEPVSTAPVAPSGGGGGRWRWAVAGLATILVFVLVGGIIVLAGPRAGTPSAVAHYAPADSAAYVELRQDLPGDQRDKLASFMSHFPGFADPSSFQQKLDDTLDELLKSSNTGLDWKNDVQTWFGGQLAVFGSTLAPTIGTPPSMVVAMTVKDQAALEAAINDRIGQAQVETQDYQGEQVKTVTAQPGGDRISYVVTDEVLLVGTRVEDVEEALDVHAGKGAALADDQFFVQQLGALHADRLATFYLDTSSIAGVASLPTDLGVPAACVSELQSAAKVRYVGELRAESDHMSATVRAEPPSGADVPPLPANKQSVLAESMPSDSIAYVEMRNVGTNAKWLISRLLDCVNTGGSSQIPDVSQLFEQFLGTQPEDYFDFLEDAALAVSNTNDAWQAGLVATVNDNAVATERVNKLLSLTTLLGATGQGLTSEKVDHNGTTITVIHATGLLEGMTDASFSVAVSGGRLYLGTGDFVPSALDRQASESLAASAQFQKATTTGGKENAGVAYLDIARLLAAYPARPGTDMGKLNGDAKPFLEPLTTFSVVNRVDGGITVSDVFVFVE